MVALNQREHMKFLLWNWLISLSILLHLFHRGAYWNAALFLKQRWTPNETAKYIFLSQTVIGHWKKFHFLICKIIPDSFSLSYFYYSFIHLFLLHGIVLRLGIFLSPCPPHSPTPIFPILTEQLFSPSATLTSPSFC